MREQLLRDVVLVLLTLERVVLVEDILFLRLLSECGVFSGLSLVLDLSIRRHSFLDRLLHF